MTNDARRTLDGKGDRIVGEQIVCECRKAGKPTLIRMTDGHRGQRVVLTGNVRCTIETTFRDPTSVRD